MAILSPFGYSTQPRDEIMSLLDPVLDRTQPPENQDQPLQRTAQTRTPEVTGIPYTSPGGFTFQGDPSNYFDVPGPGGTVIRGSNVITANQATPVPQTTQAPAAPTPGTIGGSLNPNAFLSSVSGLAPNADSARQWWAQNRGSLEGQGYQFIDHPTDPALRLPDGTMIDMIQNAGGANPKWQWLIKGGATGAPGGFQSSGLGVNTFNDPATALLQDFINFRINELLNPVQDPRRQQLATDLEGRIGQLRQPPFTSGEESALRTRSQDEIERQRQAAQRNALERISARGFAPTSGLAEQSAQDIDQFFGGQRAMESAQFGQYAVSEQQRRLDQAIEMANALAAMETAARAEEDQRRANILALASLGAELPERRLQLALATLGQAPPPGSMFNSVAAFAGLNQAQQQLALQQQAINNATNQNFGRSLGNLSAFLNTQQAPQQSLPFGIESLAPYLGVPANTGVNIGIPGFI